MSKRAQATIESRRRSDDTFRDTTIDGPPFGRRVFSPRNIVSILLTLVALYLVYRELLGLDWREAWASVREANVGLFALAFAVFYCSFPLRALRWRKFLANAGYSRKAVLMPSALGLTRIMYLSWFVNCVTVARLGDAYRAYLLMRTAGVSFAVTLGTVLAERILDLAVLVAMMGAGALVVFRGVLPPEATQALAAGLILSAAAVAILLVMHGFRGATERVLPRHLRAHYACFERGVTGSFRGRLSGGLPLLVVLSAAGWLIEGAALYLTAAAVNAPIPVAVALVVALATSLLSTVPFTPGGLGFTEAGMVLMLQWLGLDTYTAVTVTLLFRLINYWSIVILGLFLYVFSSNRNRFATERPEYYG